MKKLRLSAVVLEKGEALSRSQLKKVLGGSDSGSDDCKDECTSDKPCPSGQTCTAYHCESGGEYYVCI